MYVRASLHAMDQDDDYGAEVHMHAAGRIGLSWLTVDGRMACI